MEGYRKSVSTPHRTQEACDIFLAFPPIDARHPPPTATPFRGHFLIQQSFQFPHPLRRQRSSTPDDHIFSPRRLPRSSRRHTYGCPQTQCAGSQCRSMCLRRLSGDRILASSAAHLEPVMTSTRTNQASLNSKMPVRPQSTPEDVPENPVLQTPDRAPDT